MAVFLASFCAQEIFVLIILMVSNYQMLLAAIMLGIVCDAIRFLRAHGLGKEVMRNWFDHHMRFITFLGLLTDEK